MAWTYPTQRVELARQMGAEAVLRADAESAGAAFTQGSGFDIVLICADARSNDPIELAGLLARDRGQVVAVGAVGLHIPRTLYYNKEISFQVSRSYGPGRYDPAYEERGQDYPAGYVRWTEGRNLQAVVELLASGRLDVSPLISHRFAIEKAADAYHLITGKDGEPFMGVLLTYPQPPDTLPARRIDLPGAAAATPITGETVLGVLGAGNYASAVFLPAVQKTGGARLAGVASAAGLSARHAANKFGFAFATSDEEEILGSADINVVAVLTRHNQHARQVLRALRSGKHVYCEKPLAIHPDELAEIESALAGENLPLLTVGFNRRFAPLAKSLKTALERRGEPFVAHYRVNAGLLPLSHWTQDPAVGGGRIIGEGCHFIDFLTFLAGQAPLRVEAQALPDLNRYRQDNVLVTLTYPDGSLGSLAYLANGDKTVAKERVEVFCGGTVAVLDDFRRLEITANGKRQVSGSPLGQDKGHQAAWANFLDCVRRGGLAADPLRTAHRRHPRHLHRRGEVIARMNRRLQTIRTLGLAQSAWYALYRFGLHSGHYRRSSPSTRVETDCQVEPLWPLPAPAVLLALLDKRAQTALRKETDEILQGRARLFGGPPAAIQLAPPNPPVHWSEYELGRAPWGAADVKLIWEPARFGWAFTLGRSYRLTGDARCPAAFWQAFETFDRANPPNLGPNWASAQEIALRLVAFLFAAGAFADAPESTPARQTRLAQACVEHAMRIPLTLPYARAQHNNHQVSEGLGLYLAGQSLAAHPSAERWRELGWRELNRALQTQIAPSGVYCQHSTNYHRLMLQAALLADSAARLEGRRWPEETQWKLWDAARWLYQNIDPLSGAAPNLGHNDGSLLLPLAPGGFSDYRPTIQAAARAFAQGPIFPRGEWDELGLWLHLPTPKKTAAFELLESKGFIQQRLFNPQGPGWASLRAVRFNSRPAHADQLHTEIWYNGHNIAMDAGTYRYSAPEPWENALASSRVHNTVTLDGLDQMTRAGKFLWLDWAQGQFIKGEAGLGKLAAMHDGYLTEGVLHRRYLCKDTGSGWNIEDELLPYGAHPNRHAFCLHWLLPDWPYELEEANILHLHGPGVAVCVRVEAVPAERPSPPGVLQLIRAGETLIGPHEPSPLFGWHAPAYGQRLPALSLRFTCEAAPPLIFKTFFSFTDLPPARRSTAAAGMKSKK